MTTGNHPHISMLKDEAFHRVCEYLGRISTDPAQHSIARESLDNWIRHAQGTRYRHEVDGVERNCVVREIIWTIEAGETMLRMNFDFILEPVLDKITITWTVGDAT